MSSAAYGRLAALLQDLAEECCPGRIAVALEGGYDHTALTEGVAAVLSSLIQGGEDSRDLGVEQSSASTRVEAETLEVVQELRRVLSPFWKAV
jgi:acetoin utilization deacetylase AcuC-like enzyme